MSPPLSPEERFRALYLELRPLLLRFAVRRCDPATAEDVVADAFLVMWRREAEIPATAKDARAWAYGITRHVLMNHNRGDRRLRALNVRLTRDQPPDEVTAPSAAVSAEHRVDLARAWDRLSATHQEVLALVVFEGLDGPHAAVVLDISPVAFRLRLSRARRALRIHLGHHAAAPSRHTPEPQVERSTS